MGIEKEVFVRDVPHNLKVEDAKTTLSCETTPKKWSGRCENEAFVRDVPQNLKVEDAQTKLSCETSLKISFFESWSCENDSSTARPIRPWSWHKGAPSETVRRTSFPTHLPRHVLSCKTLHFVHQSAISQKRISCETSRKKWKLKMWKQSFRARRPSRSESARCEWKDELGPGHGAF